MSSERTYPDIHFLETDTETILSSMIALYEYMVKESGREDYQCYPGSPEAVFIAWCASIVVQQRILIEDTAKKNVPRYAQGEYLDNLAELFKDLERLPATPAVATFRCYISEAQPQSVIVPKGTRITFDGEITFETVKELEIKSGNTYGDVTGQCQTAGTIGNGLAPGQVKEIVDLYDYYQKVENTTTTSGGAQEEDDADYYYRMRESMESFSTAGPINSYIYHAKSVTSAVADVAATSPEPGVVDVRVLLQDSTQPTETVLQQIKNALNADDVRPLTDVVTVSAPEAVEFEIDLTFYTQKNGQASSDIIDDEARAAVEEYISWQTCKMGRDINPSYLIQKLMEAGVKRVEVRKPTFTHIEETKVATIKRSTMQVLNGGAEDE